MSSMANHSHPDRYSSGGGHRHARTTKEQQQKTSDAASCATAPHDTSRREPQCQEKRTLPKLQRIETLLPNHRFNLTNASCSRHDISENAVPRSNGVLIIIAACRVNHKHGVPLPIITTTCRAHHKYGLTFLS
jgi:hypothetical protein